MLLKNYHLTTKKETVIFSHCGSMVLAKVFTCYSVMWTSLAKLPSPTISYSSCTYISSANAKHGELNARCRSKVLTSFKIEINSFNYFHKSHTHTHTIAVSFTQNCSFPWLELQAVFISYASGFAECRHFMVRA